MLEEQAWGGPVLSKGFFVLGCLTFGACAQPTPERQAALEAYREFHAAGSRGALSAKQMDALGMINLSADLSGPAYPTYIVGGRKGPTGRSVASIGDVRASPRPVTARPRARSTRSRR
jgi:hypothetical protein